MIFVSCLFHSLSERLQRHRIVEAVNDYREFLRVAEDGSPESSWDVGAVLCVPFRPRHQIGGSYSFPCSEFVSPKVTGASRRQALIEVRVRYDPNLDDAGKNLAEVHELVVRCCDEAAARAQDFDWNRSVHDLVLAAVGENWEV